MFYNAKIIYLMENLPKDPAILFSYINMLLRDRYASLDSLCDDMDIDRVLLEAKLRENGWEYNSSANKFW